MKEAVDFKHGFAFKSEWFTDSGEHVLLTPGNFYERGGYRDRGPKQKYYVGSIPPDYVLRRGDLLVAMTEQAAGLLGSPMVVPEDQRFLHNQRLGLAVPTGKLPWVAGYFFHVFNSKPFRSRVHLDATGVKVRHTSPAKLGAVQIPIPDTAAEQQAVAERLDDLWSTLTPIFAIYSRKLALLGELKQSLLQKAFRGEL